MAELKPCPFCGGEAEYAHLKKRFSWVFGIWCPSYIRCKVCRATSPVTVSMEDARISWNRRAEDAVGVVHGRWTRVTAGYYECSNCMSHVAVFSGHKNYCPNCGAKMDGDGNG